MRRFWKKMADGEFGEGQVDVPRSEPRVEGDVVYDEHGDVLFGGPEGASDVSETDAEWNAVATADEELVTVEAISVHEIDTQDADAPVPPASANIFDDTAAMVDETETLVDSELEISLPQDVPTIAVAPVAANSDDAPRERAPVAPSLLHKRVNLGELRVDVARITSDIQSGERLYQRAQQRVESLMGFVERAEVDFSLLNRLEPENRRLKARNRVLEAENDSTTHERRRLEKDLANALEDAATAKANLEAASTRVQGLSTQIEGRDREIARLTTDLEQVGLKIERTQTSVEVESRENILLREQITELSGRLDSVTSERMELAKIVESLKIDCDDFRNSKSQATNEVADLRIALATAQRVNGEMKSQMVSLHEEIKGFKTQYEINVISREDRIENLENRLSDMTKQVAIKDDVAKSALADVSQMRKQRSAQDLERERLERVIEQQQRQLDEAQAQIQRSTDSMAQLDARYNDVATALSVYQKRLSSAGAEVSERDWAEPLAPPPPFEDINTTSEQEDEALTPENVEEMIMDYKLGLRNKIA